eukprot:2487109-Prymnesium_polylepis.1
MLFGSPTKKDLSSACSAAGSDSSAGSAGSAASALSKASHAVHAAERAAGKAAEKAVHAAEEVLHHQSAEEKARRHAQLKRQSTSVANAQAAQKIEEELHPRLFASSARRRQPTPAGFLHPYGRFKMTWDSVTMVRSLVQPEPNPPESNPPAPLLGLHARAANRARRGFLQPSLTPTAPESASPAPAAS